MFNVTATVASVGKVETYGNNFRKIQVVLMVLSGNKTENLAVDLTGSPLNRQLDNGDLMVGYAYSFSLRAYSREFNGKWYSTIIINDYRNVDGKAAESQAAATVAHSQQPQYQQPQRQPQPQYQQPQRQPQQGYGQERRYNTDQYEDMPQSRHYTGRDIPPPQQNESRWNGTGRNWGAPTQPPAGGQYHNPNDSTDDINNIPF
jgi:hypothetical protein